MKWSCYAGLSLLTLLDDITTVIDDVAILSKVAGIVKLDDLGFFLEKRSIGKGVLFTLVVGFN
jgi:predicted DNA repair protein MutK